MKGQIAFQIIPHAYIKSLNLSLFVFCSNVRSKPKYITTPTHKTKPASNTII